VPAPLSQAGFSTEPVEMILEWVAFGASRDEIHKAYPHLSPDDIEAARRYAANSFDRETIITAEILGDHGSSGQPSDDSLCMHGSYWTTTASLQLSPARRSMKVAYSSTCEANYAEFALH
jgi:hypothetical protein